MIITSVEEQKKNKERKSVFVDNRYAFGMDEEDWFKLGLYVGMEIDENTIEKINETCNYSKAKKYAVKSLTFKMQSQQEMAKKLEQKGYDPEIIKKVVDHLVQMEYINDRLFAQKYIKQAMNLKKLGVQRIRQELSIKGIRRDVIDDALSQFDNSQEDVLYEMVQKKMKTLKDFDVKSLNSLRGHFIRKGYLMNSINRCIEQIITESNNEK